MSIDVEKIVSEALENGFNFATSLDVSTMNPLPEVRDMCAADKCHAYNKNWSCPPACGTVDECAARIREYTNGVIVQSTIELEDEFDFEGIAELGKRHGEVSIKFNKYLHEKYPDMKILPLTAGGCTQCKECTYPDKPCRFPDRMMSPLEGYGIFVSDLCTKNNIPYNRGKGTLTYVGAFLFA